MKKFVSVIIIIIGIALLYFGLSIKVPGKQLTTYSFLSDEYSTIEEYVGGDAYNYIIGASLVGGEIAGAKAQKAIFISIGSLIACIGLLSFAYSGNGKASATNKTDEKSIQENNTNSADNASAG